MSGKTITVFLSSFLLLNAVYSQCIPRDFNYGLGYNLNNGLARVGANPYANNCNCPVPALPMPPGVSVSADNLIIDGFLDVAGRLPFLGTVAVEGLVGNNGQVEVVYGCGNGNIGIVNEGGFGVANGIGGIGPIGGYSNNVGLSSLDFNRLGCGYF